MLDSARCLERRSYYRALIDFAAERGLNTVLWHFTDDQGCTLEFDSVPGIASPHAYDRFEMKRLIRYARQRGVDLVPELASLGHSLYITRLPQYQHLNESKTIFTGICPVSDETRQVVRALIEETASVFESEHFHVGLDEANFGEHPLTAEALKTRTRGEIFADHINFVHGVVRGVGRRMWMWGDGVLHDPEVARRLPRDIVMCNWQYRPQVPHDTTQQLLDDGFDVVLCPALISHDQTLFSGEEFALPNVRCMKGHEHVTGKGRVLGSVATVWTGVRFMAESLWPAMHLAAVVMREGADVDACAALGEFARDFYGLGEGGDAAAWAQSCARVMRLSPRRAEWLAVGKGRQPEGMPVEQLEAKAAAWSSVATDLRRLTPAVRRNGRSYRTFRLMVEVAAHWYGQAARLNSVHPASPSTLERLYLKSAGLLRRVEAVWDQERFADDPKKQAPAVEFFRDDHLILLLKQGLDEVRNRLSKDWQGAVGRVSVEITEAVRKKSFI